MREEPADLKAGECLVVEVLVVSAVLARNQRTLAGPPG